MLPIQLRPALKTQKEMNEKDKTNIPHGSLSRKTTSPGDDDPEETSESSAISKRIKLDRKIIFAVKTSNEQNQDVEMAENCTLKDLKSSLTFYKGFKSDG